MILIGSGVNAPAENLPLPGAVKSLLLGAQSTLQLNFVKDRTVPGMCTRIFKYLIFNEFFCRNILRVFDEIALGWVLVISGNIGLGNRLVP